MQHWTLCEVLRIANSHHSELNYIDAHAMAPLATKRTDCDVVFDRVCDGLPGQESKYELVWQTLAPNPTDGYPSSANLVQHIWHGNLSMLLCEINRTTADAIDAWLPEVRDLSNCRRADLVQGDWRDTFNQGLPSLGDMGLAGDALTFATFDPYMISTRRHRYCENKGNMYPQDIDRVARALDSFSGGVLIQLSTYSSNGPTLQREVKKMADSTLGGSGLRFLGSASANKSMMSLIYARNLTWGKELALRLAEFEDWLAH